MKITAVETFLLQPGRQRLVVVRVRTSEPGLYGLGCATFTQRHRAVEAMLQHHLGPLVVGRDPGAIEDIWHTCVHNGYWRHGPVINSAVAGIDMALWDIKGKVAGLPCYQLWGGASRPAAAVYTYANGESPAALADAVRARIVEGYRHVRCQLGGYDGLDASLHGRPDGVLPGHVIDPREKLRVLPGLFEHLRAELGEQVELIHDVHERLAPIDAVALARALEPYRLFFLEDVLAPEDCDWLGQIRSVCATPLAMGELFTNPREIVPLLTGRLIDFLRVHLSQVGGLSPALKLAHLCETFGVRTAWHGPPDLSPVGIAANAHLDLAARAFGIQEWCDRRTEELEIFPGCPKVRDGYLYLEDAPGLGVDFDEQLARRFPPDDANPQWTIVRTPDGTIHRP